MCSQRTLIASPPFAPTILCQILRILLISLKSVNRPISSGTSHHVTLRTGGQASVVYSMAAKATTKRGLLPGYFESLQQKESKERYPEKLKSIDCKIALFQSS